MKPFGRAKNYRVYKTKIKRILIEGGVDMIQKVCVMERLKIDFMKFGQRWRLFGSVSNS